MRRLSTTSVCRVSKEMEGGSRGLIKDMHGESSQIMNTAVGIPVADREFVLRN
jgi:hypothetical protein